MEFESRIIKSAVAALVGIACMTANCAEFLGELYEAEWFSKTDCGFYLPTKVKWDVGDRLFDEYMVVDGVKYPEREYSAAWKNFLLIPVSLGKPGEKFTPVVVNGTTSGEVGVSVMTDEQVYRQFCNSQTDWMRDYWLNKVFPNGMTSSLRAWIKVLPGQSKTKLRANVDLSKRPAAGIYSNYSMTDLAMEYGVDYFKGVFPVAPSTWYAIGIKETGEIFVPTKSGLDSPRLYVCQLVSCKEFFKAFSIDDMDETMGEDRCEAIVCPAAWYVSAKDAGGAELVVWSENIRMGTVSGNGIYKPGTKVSLRATVNKGCVFAGWYDADGNPLTGGSVDYRTATYAYVTTDKDVTLTAKFATNSEDASSLALVNITNCTAGAGSAFAKEMSPHVVSHSTPKLAVSGLPAGLKYDAKTMTISGKATKPGVYTVKVAATNASVKKATDDTTKTFKITVPNFSTPVLPNLKSAPDAYGVIRVGVEYSSKDIIDFSPVDTGWTVSVSGLPAGLTYKNGVVSGIPKKAGCYTVTVTAKRGKETQVATITFNVEALPSWVVGKFYGPHDCRGVNGSDYKPFQNNPQAYKYWDWECPCLSEITISSDGKVSIVCREVNNSVSSTVNTRLFLDGNGDYCIEEAMVAKGKTFERYYGFKVTKLPGFDLGFITGNEMGVDSDEDAYFSEWTAYQDAYTANPAGLPLPEFGSGANVTIPANVKSTRFPGRYENGYLTLKFGANGAVTPSWVGYGNYKMIKTRLLPFAVDGEGAVYANICVLGYSRERGFGLFYTLCIPVTNDGVADVSNIKYTLDKVMMDDW